MGFFKKVKDGLLGTDGTGGGSGQQGVITAQELVDQAFEHFKMRLNDSSTDMSLLFPTSMIIYLNPEDYNARKQEFPARANDIKKKCMKEVRTQISGNPEWQDYIPHSKYWKIQFVEFKPECVISSDTDPHFSVEKGHVMIVSDLYANDLGESIGDSASSGGRVVTTVHNIKGTTSLQNLAINPDAFKDVTILGQNCFRIEFLRSDLADTTKNNKQSAPLHTQTPPASNNYDIATGVYNGNTSKQSNSTPKKVAAELQIWDSYFLVNGQKADKYIIESEKLQIAGPNANASTDGAELLKIDDDSIMNPHLNIRYDNTNQRYLISAVGDTKLNTRILERNADNWSELPNNSTILLNGDIQLNFTLKNV